MDIHFMYSPTENQIPFVSGFKHCKDETESTEKDEQRKIEAEEKCLKMERKRQRIVEEILATEKTYQHHLNLVIKCFEVPLYENQLIPSYAIVTIFSNISQLLKVNQELSMHLKGTTIGQAFLQMGPFLKLYSTYANNHERALGAMMDWDQKCPGFSSFRRHQEEQENMEGLKLNALLITPVQRIPRYKLLLTELLSNTQKDHKDYCAIEEAIIQISEVANHINDHIKQQDNSIRMLAIQKSLVGPEAPKLITPGRIFIKDGCLKKVSKKGGKSYERMFFLFSDMLMYCKQKTLETRRIQYTCCCVLPVQHCKVQRIFGTSHGDGSLFTITCKDENLLVYSDRKTVDSWIKAITSAIQAFKSNRNTLRKPSSAKVPLRRPELVRLRRKEKNFDPLASRADINNIALTPEKPHKESPRLLKNAFRDSLCRSPLSKFNWGSPITPRSAKKRKVKTLNQLEIGEANSSKSFQDETFSYSTPKEEKVEIQNHRPLSRVWKSKSEIDDSDDQVTPSLSVSKPAKRRRFSAEDTLDNVTDSILEGVKTISEHPASILRPRTGPSYFGSNSWCTIQ